MKVEPASDCDCDMLVFCHSLQANALRLGNDFRSNDQFTGASSGKYRVDTGKCSTLQDVYTYLF
jgi:hypothetical protein